MAGNINFVPMSSYDMEGQEIARRRKMAEMLQAQSMAPIEQQSVGGMVAPISITHGLAKLLQGYSARKGQEAADADTRALSARYQGDQLSDAQLLAQAMEGRPATAAQNPQSSTDPLPGEAQMVPGQAAIPAGRIDPALIGQVKTPEMRNTMLQMLAAQMKKTPADAFGKVDAKDYTPESVAAFAQTGNFASLVPVRKRDAIETVGPDGRPVTQFVDLYNPPTTPMQKATKVEVAPSGMAYNPYTVDPGSVFPNPNNIMNLDPRNPTGPAVANQPLIDAKGRIAAAGAPKVNLAVNTDKGYLGEVAQGLAKSDVGVIDAGRSAPDRMATAQRIKEVLAKNPITGTGAEARLALNKAFSTAGVIDGDRTKNTEDLAGLLAASTLDAIKTSGLGGGQGFTDKDRQFLEKARSGNIEINAGTLRTLADLNERSARESIKKANATVERLRRMPGSGNMGANLEAIQEPTAASSGMPPPPAGFVVNGGR